MKWVMALFFTSVFTVLTRSQESPSVGIAGPHIDERIELLSMIFRLAGNPEYNQDRYPIYVDRINRHFEPFKDHPIVEYARELRQKNFIGYDAVMHMAIHLGNPPDFKPIMNFTAEVPERRWGIEAAEKFAILIPTFYKDADCSTFFQENKDLYELATGRFGDVFDQMDLSWYRRFYGKQSDGRFSVVIGLGNGGANYGPKIVYKNGLEHAYAILGTWSIDEMGAPVYPSEGYLSTLIHEFNHSFVNVLTEINEDELKDAGVKIFRVVASEMRSQAYGSWQTMLSEALVRASVIRYLMDHEMDESEIADEITSQLRRGFYWMESLVELLDDYERKRSNYPTLESFMPRIIKYYRKTAKEIESIKADYLKLCPRVVAMEPFQNGATDVNSGIEEIVIHFDQPLIGRGYSINHGTLGEDHFPIKGVLGYLNDNKAIKLSVDLQPDTEYDFMLTGQSFRNTAGYALQNTVIRFRTRPE